MLRLYSLETKGKIDYENLIHGLEKLLYRGYDTCT